MQLPVKVHYATLAMLALAEKHTSKEPLSARIIANEQGIPSQFLTQILQQLRASNLVVSTRGANGGFLLDGAPNVISLSDIFDSICPSSSAPISDEQSIFSEAVNGIWEELRQQERQMLQGIKLSDLLERVQNSTDMFYI
ncbi:MAG: Rrf2 family transcriptional regulator [Planctomycetota bacterium]